MQSIQNQQQILTDIKASKCKDYIQVEIIP